MWMYCTDKAVDFWLFNGTLNNIVHKGNNQPFTICENDEAFFIVDEHAFATKERLETHQISTIEMGGNVTEHDISGWKVPMITPTEYLKKKGEN